MKSNFQSAGVLCLLTAAFCFSATVAAGAHWQAGVAAIDITPEVPVPMAGYASRSQPFESVEQKIYAKALAFEDPDGRRAVLVTTDLIGIPRAVGEPVCQEIERHTGLQRNQILLSSSHTHSAPLLTLDEKARYNHISPEDTKNLTAYTRALQSKLLQVVREALSQLEPAELSWGAGMAHFAVNRREFTPRGVILGVNPSGLVDRTVPVLRVDSDGELLAVLFAYACHNTTLTGNNHKLCGDYAGFAQAYIQERHPEAQALFITGCGGDANPYPRGTLKNAQDHGAALGEEVCQLLDRTLRPIDGSLTCTFAEADLPLQSFDREELETMLEGPSWQSGNARQMLAKLDRGETLPATFQAPVAVWQFGDDLTLAALPGELVVDYVPLLQKALGPLQLWIAAYCNDVPGYIPSARVLNEGGYECRGLYTTTGFFPLSVQDVLVDKVRELARQAGRTLPE